MVSYQEFSLESHTHFVQQLEQLQKNYECPIHFTLLTEAVSLVPCMHKVNLAAAQQLFGSMKIQVEKSNSCPLCRQVVVAYYPDHHIRDAAQQLSILYQTYLNMTCKDDPWFLSFERQHKKQEAKIELKNKLVNQSEHCFLKIEESSKKNPIQDTKEV